MVYVASARTDLDSPQLTFLDNIFPSLVYVLDNISVFKSCRTLWYFNL